MNNILNIRKELERYEPIGLEDVSGSRLMNRVDTKFVFHLGLLPELLSNLRHTYQVLEINNKRMMTYESLYLDDNSYSFYLAHHNKRDHRYKARFRHYVDSGDYFLEVKEKRKGRTVKERIKKPSFEYELSDNSEVFLDNYLENPDLTPSLWNTYERITLVDERSNERVTIDIGLEYRWKEKKKKFANLAIAELKQKKINRSSSFYRLMKSQLIRPFSISKYCIGLLEVRGGEGLKYNRFKKKVRTINKINNAS